MICIDFQLDIEDAERMFGIDKILQNARSLIGMQIRHAGMNCTIIEVMDDCLTLILEADTSAQAIQADAYGNARREMRILYHLPILNQTGDGLHPDFARLSENANSASHADA